MTTPIHPPAHDADRPLLDLDGLAAGIRWHRRLWLLLAVIGLLLGIGAATVLPSRSSATTDLFVIHANEETSDGTSLMKTDVALLQTTTVAAVAVDRLHSTMTPENFVNTYSGVAVADNILEITTTGANDAEALARAQAVADAFITVHVKQSDDATQASVKAYSDRRDQAQSDLDELDRQIAAVGQGADSQALNSRRGNLASQIASLSQQADQASIGAPQVAAGTKILNAPHRTSRGFATSLVLFGAIGLGAGLVLGLLIAAIAAIVRDRPVLRRDIVAHLGASVVAQIPAPLRGPRKLIRRSSAEKERARTAATLVRLIRESPKPVSVLELRCARAAAALVKDMAEELALERSVVVIDDLPGGEMVAALGGASEVELIPGAEFPPATPTPRDSRCRQLAIATVGPGTPWTDLHRLGVESLVVVRAGRVEATWLHTVARQLADAGIAIIGLVVVHPDPRDKSDGTVWDALHTAIRGRVAAGGRAPVLVAPPVPGPVQPAAMWPQVPPSRVGGTPFAPGHAARANGRPHLHGHPDATPVTEAIPVDARIIQIDSPTMVIPINRDGVGTRRTAGPDHTATERQAPGRQRPTGPTTDRAGRGNGLVAGGPAGNGRAAANGTSPNGAAAARSSAGADASVNGSVASRRLESNRPPSTEATATTRRATADVEDTIAIDRTASVSKAAGATADGRVAAPMAGDDVEAPGSVDATGASDARASVGMVDATVESVSAVTEDAVADVATDGDGDDRAADDAQADGTVGAGAEDAVAVSLGSDGAVSDGAVSDGAVSDGAAADVTTVGDVVSEGVADAVDADRAADGTDADGTDADGTGACVSDAAPSDADVRADADAEDAAAADTAAADTADAAADAEDEDAADADTDTDADVAAAVDDDALDADVTEFVATDIDGFDASATADEVAADEVEDDLFGDADGLTDGRPTAGHDPAGVVPDDRLASAAEDDAQPAELDDWHSRGVEPRLATAVPIRRPRPRPRPRLLLADHPTDKFRPVVPGTPAKKEAT